MGKHVLPVCANDKGVGNLLTRSFTSECEIVFLTAPKHKDPYRLPPTAGANKIKTVYKYLAAPPFYRQL